MMLHLCIILLIGTLTCCNAFVSKTLLGRKNIVAAPTCHREDLTLQSSLLEPTAVELTQTAPVKNQRRVKVIEEFVAKKGGKRPIQKVLVANNGMAATKAIMSMRQWAYNNLGDERAIEFVAMATKDDLNANAEFIRLADTFVEVPSGSNKVRRAVISTFINNVHSYTLLTSPFSPVSSYSLSTE